MPDEIWKSIWPFWFLFLVPLDLWLVSVILTDFLKKLKGNPKGLPHQVVFSLNFAYAYLSVDAIVSTTVCVSLYQLTYEGTTALSPSALLIRWSGIGLVLMYCSLDFPIKPMVKLLWPILTRWQDCPRWIKKLNGIHYRALGDLLLPWIDSMGDAAHWVGLCVVGGAVVPYLAVLTVSGIVEYLATTLELSRVAETMLGFLLSLSDWGGAFVILTLMLNLLVLSFRRLTIGQILHE